MVITQTDLRTKYSEVVPVNGNILAFITEKESDVKIGSIIIPEGINDADNIARAYVMVEKLSAEAEAKFPNLKRGDLVEVMASKAINSFPGPKQEKFVIFHMDSIVGIYTKKE